MGKSLIVAGILGALSLVGYGVVTGYAEEGDSQPIAPGAAHDRWAQSPLGRLIMGRRGRALVLRSELGITDEQRAKIHAVLTNNRKKIAEALAPVAERRNNLRLAALADKPDDKVIRQSADALGKAVADAAVEMAGLAGELRNVLTDEQLGKVREFHQDNQRAVDGYLEGLLGE
jgi:Spy/CpxP family protein refolding chaperone